MNLKVFYLNENKYLEFSSQKSFLASCTDGKSHYWIDVEKPDPTSFAELVSSQELHPLVLEGCLEPVMSSHVAPYQQSLFIKLSTQLDWGSTNQSFLSIICLPQAIITVHEESITALENLATEFSGALRFHKLNTSAILYQILDRLIDEDMALALKSHLEIETLEVAMDQEADSVQIEQILMLKQRVAHLAVIFEDQRYSLTTLVTVESEVFDITDLREYFRDSLWHLEYALSSVGRQEALLSALHQHYLLTLQDKVNKRLRLLTVISAVFLPLTLIAGIYGMNFRHMPELAWRFGYPLVIAVMLAFACVLLWAFHRKGWFK